MKSKLGTLILYTLPVAGGFLISQASSVPPTGYTVGVAAVGLMCLVVSAPLIYWDMYCGDDVELTPAESEWLNRRLNEWEQNAKSNHLS